jgi:hypothetical protein
LAGGDGRSHGSRGHHGDGVFCVDRLRGFLVSGERRGEKPLVELISRQMTSQELSFVK